jgi:hypothetical protein
MNFYFLNGDTSATGLCADTRRAAIDGPLASAGWSTAIYDTHAYDIAPEDEAELVRDVSDEPAFEGSLLELPH